MTLNPIQDGGEAKSLPPPTSCSPVTSIKVKVSPQNFWLLVLILLTHWCKISRSYLVPLPNYWTWTKTTLQKKSAFSGQILIKLKFFIGCWSFQALVTWPHLHYNLSHVIKFHWWRHRQNFWRHKSYFKIPLF